MNAIPFNPKTIENRLDDITQAELKRIREEDKKALEDHKIFKHIYNENDEEENSIFRESGSAYGDKTQKDLHSIFIVGNMEVSYDQMNRRIRWLDKMQLKYPYKEEIADNTENPFEKCLNELMAEAKENQNKAKVSSNLKSTNESISIQVKLKPNDSIPFSNANANDLPSNKPNFKLPINDLGKLNPCGNNKNNYNDDQKLKLNFNNLDNNNPTQNKNFKDDYLNETTYSNFPYQASQNIDEINQRITNRLCIDSQKKYLKIESKDEMKKSNLGPNNINNSKSSNLQSYKDLFNNNASKKPVGKKTQSSFTDPILENFTKNDLRNLEKSEQLIETTRKRIIEEKYSDTHKIRNDVRKKKKKITNIKWTKKDANSSTSQYRCSTDNVDEIIKTFQLEVENKFNSNSSSIDPNNPFVARNDMNKNLILHNNHAFNNNKSIITQSNVSYFGSQNANNSLRNINNNFDNGINTLTQTNNIKTKLHRNNLVEINQGNKTILIDNTIGEEEDEDDQAGFSYSERLKAMKRNEKKPTTSLFSNNNNNPQSIFQKNSVNTNYNNSNQNNNIMNALTNNNFVSNISSNNEHNTKNGFFSEGLGPFRILNEAVKTVGMNLQNTADLRNWYSNDNNQNATKCVSFKVIEIFSESNWSFDQNGNRERSYIPVLNCLNNEGYFLIRCPFHLNFPFRVGGAYTASLVLVYENFEFDGISRPETYNLLDVPQILNID